MGERDETKRPWHRRRLRGDSPSLCAGAGSGIGDGALFGTEKPLRGANVYPAGRVVEASVPKGATTEIVTEFATVTCLENQIGVKITNAGGKGLSVIGRVATFVFNQCTVPDGKGGTEACTVKAVNKGATEGEQYLATFTAKGSGNGELGIGASSLGLMGFAVSCAAPAKVDCTFEGAPNLTFTGGPVLGVAGTIGGSPSMTPKKGGAKCPAAAATWKFKWEITSPSPLFLQLE